MDNIFFSKWLLMHSLFSLILININFLVLLIFNKKYNYLNLLNEIENLSIKGLIIFLILLSIYFI